jgi:signal transduction histidine kinase/ligand-binding sensor domain-containing protein
MIKKLAVVLLLMLYRLDVFPSPGNYAPFKFDHLTTANGLSSNRIFCVFRDSKGFLWLGTDVGLDRYDGYSVKNYRNDERKPHSLSSNSVRCILEDSYHNLWIGTANGLNMLNRDVDSFYVFKNNPSDKNSINSNSITYIFEDSYKNLWVVTGAGCLNRLNRATGNFQRFSIPHNHEYSLNHQVNSIAEDSKGNLWVVSFSPEIFRFNPKTGEFKSFPCMVSDFGEDRKGIFIDSDDDIWIYTENHGLFQYNSQENTFTTFKIAPDGTGTNLATIRDMIQEDKTHLLIGIDQGGINRYNKTSRHFEYIMYDENKDNVLYNNGIWDMFKDKEGILWVACSGGGINYIDPNKNRFNLFQHKINKLNSLSSNFTECFYEDKGGKIWVGTDGGGLNLFDPKTGIFKAFKHDEANPYSIAGNVIRSIAGDNHDNLWIASWEGGLNFYERKTGRFYRYLLDKQKANISSDRIWYLKVAHNNVLWIGMLDDGIVLFDKDKGVLKRFRNKPGDDKSLSDNRIFYMYEDPEKVMWVCTGNGLCRFDSVHQNFIKIRDLPYRQIRAFCIDKAGYLWVGTATHGLCMLGKNGNLIRTYNKSDGLCDNIINGIAKDNKGDLWISTNNGLSHFIRQKGIFRNYSNGDGLQDNQFFSLSFLKTRDGKLYLGGMNGFNSFYPDSLKDNPYIPQVVITDFQLLNSSSLVESEDHSLKQISACKGIILHPNQNVFSFIFAATNLTYPEKNQYAYMLEGFDENWIFTSSNRRYVTYTNLNPGHYTFKVKASNNDGLWNETGASVDITILPPWYKTLWFRILFFSFIGFIVFLFYYLRTSFYRKQKALLTRMVKEKTQSLEETTAFLEEGQEEIKLQKEELMAQKEVLEQINKILLEQKQQILEQNVELDKHRNQLESQVEERTRELVAAKLKAEESDRLKSAFLSNMSHEIRTPMNSIVGFASLLKEEGLSEVEKENMIRIIIQSSETLLLLINDILDLSKIEANQMDLNVKSFDIVLILKEIQNIFSFEAKKKNIQLIVDYDLIRPKLELKSDLIRIKQVFTNLVNNAIKFTSNGMVKFGVKSITGGFITFFVKDTGIGIPPDTGTTIFERFRKLENKDQLYSGTGLGLAICKSVVNLWKGKIWYESIVGSGATFYFTHPLHTDSQLVNDKFELQPSENDSFNDKTILVAEDQENNYLLLQAYLRKTKAKLIWVQDGYNAVQFALNNIVDLILMDIKMPGIDGIEATQQIKTAKPQIPIVAQTAYAFENEIHQFSKYGFDDYLVKPIQIRELYFILHKYLSQ